MFGYKYPSLPQSDLGAYDDGDILPVTEDSLLEEQHLMIWVLFRSYKFSILSDALVNTNITADECIKTLSFLM